MCLVWYVHVLTLLRFLFSGLPFFVTHTGIPFRRKARASSSRLHRLINQRRAIENLDLKLRGGWDERPSVNSVIFVIHGIGAETSNLERCISQFRHALDVVRLDSFHDTPCETHIEMIDWKSSVQAEQMTIMKRLKPDATIAVSDMRDTFNNAATDIMYYMTPCRKQALIADVTAKLNSAFSKLLSSDPHRFQHAKVAIVGYSLGSLIIHDILASSDNRLIFPVHSLFLWGSPLAAYLDLKSTEVATLELPRSLRKYFNIYHPLDPFAFRQDPLLYREGFSGKKAATVPKWYKGHPSLNTLLYDDDEPGIDFVIQDRQHWFLCRIVAAFSMFTAHGCYWANHDVALFILNQLNRD